MNQTRSLVLVDIGSGLLSSACLLALSGLFELTLETPGFTVEPERTFYFKLPKADLLQDFERNGFSRKFRNSTLRSHLVCTAIQHRYSVKLARNGSAAQSRERRHRSRGRRNGSR